MTRRAAAARAPGSVGNVICGFDLLGLCLEAPSDTVVARFSETPGLRIGAISGDGGRLPTSVTANSAGVAASALLKDLGRGLSELLPDPFCGIALELHKGLPLSGGMGGSAASAVAAVVAVNALLALDAGTERLFHAALTGEAAVAGGEHGDNVAPSLLGGIVLARPGRLPLSLPVPMGLSVALLHPELEHPTREGRARLPPAVPMADAVLQAGHTAAFVASLFTGDPALLADSLQDRLAEPYRRDQLPGFDAVRSAALGAGALACGISGAGPSLVALCRSRGVAAHAGAAMLEAFQREAGLRAEVHLSGVGQGCEVVEVEG